MDAFHFLQKIHEFREIDIFFYNTRVVIFFGFQLVIMAGTGALSYFVLTGWIKELNQVVPNDLKEYVVIPIGKLRREPLKNMTGLLGKFFV